MPRLRSAAFPLEYDVLALTPQNNEQFAREVDEELRREEALALWKRWGKLIVVAIAAALLAFAGWLYWQSHRENVAGEQGVKFNQAMDDLGANQQVKAVPELAELATSGTQGYAALAKFTQADIALQKQDLKGRCQAVRRRRQRHWQRPAAARLGADPPDERRI